MNINNKDVSVRIMWLLFSIAAFSFIFTLNLPHIGEEGVYTVSSFEMWYHKHYLYPILYGESYGRPPFFNWLILSLTNVIGWSHMLLTSRLVTAVATVGTGLMTAWFAQNIFHDRRVAAFSALAYLASDILIYHGWLAYADPVFGFCILSAVACLWISCERECFWLLIAAMLGLVAAFLTKSLTAYVFYITAFMILLGLGKRKFLLCPISIVLHLMVLCVPLLWTVFTHDPGKSRLVHDILSGILGTKAINPIKYLVKFIAFPPEIFARMLPVTAITAYYFWRNREKLKIEHKSAMKFLVLFVGINFLPYWISSTHASRYVQPLFPFVVLWCSYIICSVNMRAIHVALRWFVVIIVVKYVSIIFWRINYPAYYGCGGGDYIQIAKDVVARTKNLPLYTNHFLAVDSVIDIANILRYPLAPAVKVSLIPPKEKDYFVLIKQVELDNSNVGKIVHEYSLGKGGKLCLLCYGKACL